MRPLKHLAFFVAVVALCLPACAQSTRPTTRPVAVWFQPLSNLERMAALGITHCFGPELENPPKTTLKGWSAKADSLGMKVVLKLPAGYTDPLPTNCVGVLMSVDEPNGKNIKPDALKAEYDLLKLRYPHVPVFLSLAGDKITSANFNKPAELQLYRDYAAVCDIATVNAYSKNRNASRYPTTWTADAVKKLKAVSGEPVWAWIECSDQRLDKVEAEAPGRGPTAQEMRDQVNAAIDAGGADGVGWFATADNGWARWPESFWAGVVNEEQDRAVKEITFSVAGPRAPPPTTQPVSELKAQLDRIETLSAGRLPTVMPVYNGATANRELANGDPALRPFTWLHGAMWHPGTTWDQATDIQLRVAGMIAAQTGYPVNFDHERNPLTINDANLIAEHVKRLRVGAMSTGANWGVKLNVGVYDARWLGTPVSNNNELAEGSAATAAKVTAAVKALEVVWKEVDYVIIDSYLTRGYEARDIKATANAIKYIQEGSGKKAWVYIGGRLTEPNTRADGGLVPIDVARQHIKAMKDAGAVSLIVFGDYADFEQSYRKVLVD